MGMPRGQPEENVGKSLDCVPWDRTGDTAQAGLGRAGPNSLSGSEARVSLVVCACGWAWAPHVEGRVPGRPFIVSWKWPTLGCLPQQVSV